MPENEQKKHSATARYNDALARLKDEERRFGTRQKIILGGALIALRRKNGDAGAKLLRALIPYISKNDRSTVSDLLEVQERLPYDAPKEHRKERRRDAVAVAAARMAVRKHKPRPDDDDGEDDGCETDRGRPRPPEAAEEL